MYWVYLMVAGLILVTIESSGIKLRTPVNFDESQEFPEFTTVVGGVADLPCNVSRPGPDDAVSLVLWYRADINPPIYSVDARNGDLMDAKHFSSDLLGSRAFFDLRTQPAIMKIKPVLEKDVGDYRCRVDYRWARTLNSAVTLTVKVPPKEIVIFNENNEMLKKIVGPLDEGSELKLTCQVKGGKPSPSLTWWRNDELINDDYSETIPGVVRNILVIPSLKRDHLLSSLTCVANNTNITSPLNTSVIIDLNLKPVDVRIKFFRRPLSAGKKVKIICQSSGSRPPAQVTWWKDNKPMSSLLRTPPESQNVTVSELIFSPSREDNGKTLMCTSNNPKISGSTIEDKWNLTVFYKPEVIIKLGVNQVSWTVAEGRDIHLLCEVDAIPSITSSGWYFNDQAIQNDHLQRVAVNNLTLMIQRVQRHHSGYYRCFATNVEGRGESKNVLVKVEFAPVCSIGQKKVYGLSVNETVFFTCHVEADPPAFSFRWSFNNSSAGQEVLNYNSTAGLKSIAYFTPREKRDYSSLYCWGRNHIGIQREPCVFSLVFISPPEPLKNCTISNTTAKSIHLECVAGYDGGLQQYFFLEVYNAKLERLTANITSNSKPEFHVFELLEGSRFILLLYSANTKGKSSPVVLTAKTKPVTQNYVGATSSLLLNPLVGVLIGTVVSLILITIIITVIIRLRSYDNDKDDTTDQIPTSSNELQRENIPESGEQDSKDPDIIPTKDDWNYLPKRKQGKSFCEILVPSEQSATVHTRQKNYAGVPKESTNNNPLEVQKNCGCHSSYRNCCIAEFSLVTKEPSTQRNSTGCNTLSTFRRPSGENVSADYTFNCNSSGFSSTPRIKYNKQRKFTSTAV